MSVYLAHAPAVGLWKIGMSRYLRGRIKQLSGVGRGRVELVAAIEGGRTREEALKWLMRSECVEGEWFQDCFRLRALAKAMKWHDLRWLMVPEIIPGHQLRAALRDRYGSLAKAAAPLGCSACRLRAATGKNGHFSPIVYGRFIVENDLASPWPHIDRRLHPNSQPEALAA